MSAEPRKYKKGFPNLRMKEGERLWIDFELQPKPGDEVRVCLTDDQELIRVLVSRDDKVITLAMIDDSEDTVTIPVEQLVCVQVITGVLTAAMQRQK